MSSSQRDQLSFSLAVHKKSENNEISTFEDAPNQANTMKIQLENNEANDGQPASKVRILQNIVIIPSAEAEPTQAENVDAGPSTVQAESETINTSPSEEPMFGEVSSIMVVACSDQRSRKVLRKAIVHDASKPTAGDTCVSKQHQVEQEPSEVTVDINRDPRLKIGARRVSALNVHTTGQGQQSATHPTLAQLPQPEMRFRNHRVTPTAMPSSQLCAELSTVVTNLALDTDLKGALNSKLTSKSRKKLQHHSSLPKIIMHEGENPFAVDRRFSVPSFLAKPRFARYGIAILFPNLCLPYLADKCCISEDRCPWLMKHKLPAPQDIRAQMEHCEPGDISDIFKIYISARPKFFRTYMHIFCQYFGDHKMHNWLYEAADVCLNPRFKYIRFLQHCINGLILTGLPYHRALSTTLIRIKGNADDTSERNQIILSLILDERNENIPKFAKLLDFMAKSWPHLFVGVHINALLLINDPRLSKIKWDVITYASTSNKSVLAEVDQERLLAFCDPLNI